VRAKSKPAAPASVAPRPEEAAAAAALGLSFDALDAHAKRVALHVAQQRHIARPPVHHESAATRGQRAADAVARFGGSWKFVGLFGAVMALWVLLNAGLLLSRGTTFDPYPYTLLNLFLSMLAAIQAPVILMSQNRQADKDRISAGHDYDINLKAELEIMLLHQKVDLLRQPQWMELLALQREQLRLLAAITERRSA
jgi:uncharacterized membrane protein